jgi:hypothetical protein
MINTVSAEITKPQMTGLTPDEFRSVASVYLADTSLLLLVAGVELQANDEGEIVSHVSDNLRTMLVVAERMTPDPKVREKCGQMLGLWAKAAQN